MAKRIAVRMLAAAPFGPLITIIICLFISAQIGTGQVYMVTPEAAEYFGSDLSAFTFEVLSVLLYGAAWGAISIIWEVPSWSLTKQTLLHFFLTATATFPVMYLNYWVPHTERAIAGYYLVFALIYAAVWAVLYLRTRTEIRRLNRAISGEQTIPRK